MAKKVWISLFTAFIIYSIFVYSECDGTNPVMRPNVEIEKGWALWQDKNCQSCHQLYGLGGYMGPDLTNTASQKGINYMKGFIKYGTGRMPNFHLTEDEIGDLTAFLSWVDKSGKSTVSPKSVHWTGTYIIER